MHSPNRAECAAGVTDRFCLTVRRRIEIHQRTVDAFADYLSVLHDYRGEWFGAWRIQSLTRNLDRPAHEDEIFYSRMK